MKLDTYYQRGRYDKTSQQERLPYYANRLAVFSRILKGKKFEKILDVGCGDGGLAKLMQDALGAEVYGTDISAKGVEIANKKGIRAKVADLSKEIPFEDNYFDLIIANELIEHLVNPDLFLRECNRVLKKDGAILIATPNLSFWLNRLLFLLGVYPIFLEASTERKVGLGFFSKFSYGFQPVGHIHVFNYNSIIDALKLHDYNIEKIAGDRVPFVSPGSKVLTIIYGITDFIFSKFPALSSNLIVLAQK